MKQKIHFKWAKLSRIAGVIAGMSALLLTTSSSQAQVLVTGTFSQVGVDYLYNFQVENTSGVDVSFINVFFDTQMASLVITNETAPGDYLFDYDSGSLVFIEGTSSGPFLAGATVGGFSLTSNAILAPDSLEAFDVDANLVTATFSATAVTVPEPGTLSLIALSASFLAGTVVRRRNVARL